MPRRDELTLGLNILVEEESWVVVEYDHTSVPGVMYISLTEGKVNSLVDDLENNIADTDKIAVYELSMPPINQIFELGAHIQPGRKEDDQRSLHGHEGTSEDPCSAEPSSEAASAR